MHSNLVWVRTKVNIKLIFIVLYFDAIQMIVIYSKVILVPVFSDAA